MFTTNELNHIVNGVDMLLASATRQQSLNKKNPLLVETYKRLENELSALKVKISDGTAELLAKKK